MTGSKRAKQTLALGLATLMTAASLAPAAAAPIDSGVTPAYDEAYYATLDYYGNLMEGSVVKSYALNGADRLTDYGVYDEIVNLTDGTPATLGDGTAAFQFSQSPSHFYFEGKTKKPFQDLPWTITLRYTLNGVPAEAEDLAGKTGVVEIFLDIVPNKGASDYARYNYTLEAMALFNEDDILSLEAPGAQVQLVGNLRTVLFLALPGEEQHFSIRVGSDDFSFGGMTVLMAPATLAQLEEIAKLSQRKDDLEEDYRALSGSLDALLDAMKDMQDGLNASASGLDQLNAARGTISKGKGTIYSDAGVLRGDLSNIAGLLEPVEQRTMALSQTITNSKAVLGGMTDTVVSLRTQLDDLEKALTGLEEGAGDVRQVIRGLADMKSSLRSLQRALGDSHVGGSSSGDRNAPKLKEQVEKTKQVGSAYNESNDVEFMAKMLELQGQSPEKIAGIKNLVGLTQQQAEAMGVASEWQAAQGAKAQTDAMYQAKGSLSFQQFCGTLPGVDDKTAKQMSDLWTVYNSGAEGTRAAQSDAGMEAEAGAESERLETKGAETEAVETEAVETEAAESESVETEVAETGTAESEAAETAVPEIGAETETEKSQGAPGTAGAVLSAAVRPGAGMLSAALAGSGLYVDETTAGSLSEAGGAGDAASPAADHGKQTVGGAAVDLIVDGLDNALNQANNKINAIQNELNSTIDGITRPTGRVVGELADLCDDVDDLVDLIDSAEDVSAALRQSSEKLRSILDDVDALRNLLNEYEPTLQESVANVGTLSTSAAAALRDLETLMADTEALMKTSGSQLDDGTRQALQGLAATLRQTAKAMAATGDVRDAKATINTIIEDTWNEYTGDVNNILLMDAEAQAVSLTDSRNPAPSSVQILIRTQEIKAEEPDEEAEEVAAKTETTFWGRVAQMFKDFWRAITGIFH